MKYVVVQFQLVDVILRDEFAETQGVKVEGVYGPFDSTEDAQAWIPNYNDGYAYDVQPIEDPAGD